MLKECERCLFRCKYLQQKNKFLSAAASGRMDRERARELIEIWMQEGIELGCDELKSIAQTIED